MEGDAWKLLAERAKLKAEAYTKVAAKAQRDFVQHYQQLCQDAFATRNEISRDEQERAARNWQKEFKINLTETYLQLGLDTTPIKPVYRTTVNVTGWNNIDRYVAERTTKRETIDITHNGRRAVIQYEPWTAQIADSAEYDRLLVYLLPDRLSSYQRVLAGENGFQENINELINYHAVVIGYRGEQLYLAHTKDIQAGINDFTLQAASTEDLQTAMTSMNRGKQGTELGIELLQRANLHRLEQETVVAQSALEFHESIREVVLQCYVPVLDELEGGWYYGNTVPSRVIFQ